MIRHPLVIALSLTYQLLSAATTDTPPQIVVLFERVKDDPSGANLEGIFGEILISAGGMARPIIGDDFNASGKERITAIAFKARNIYYRSDNSLSIEQKRHVESRVYGMTYVVSIWQEKIREKPMGPDQKETWVVVGGSMCLAKVNGTGRECEAILTKYISNRLSGFLVQLSSDNKEGTSTSPAAPPQPPGDPKKP